MGAHNWIMDIHDLNFNCGYPFEYRYSLLDWGLFAFSFPYISDFIQNFSELWNHFKDG